MADVEIPKEAINALDIIRELLGNSVIGVYLYGSAVMGGLRNGSDVDVLVVTKNNLSEIARRKLANSLMIISGKTGYTENTDFVRPLEVTVVNRDDIVPWKYPPRKEFIYGEWLRSEYEQGYIPEPVQDSDLAILLYQARHRSVPLFGSEASEILDFIPMADIRRAMRDCIPGLMDWLKGDERNVILTFARIWVTAATGEIIPKDEAAKWALPHLPPKYAELLDLAGEAYRGERIDKWDGMDKETFELAHYMKNEIESILVV